MDDAKVALVGHCGPDANAMRSAIRGMFPKGEVTMVGDAAGLAEALGAADVLLVNRVLDGEFENSSGIDLIRVLAEKAPGDRPALLLVSNYSESQAEARAAGAMAGFGKKQLYSAEMRRNLEAAVAARRSGNG